MACSAASAAELKARGNDCFKEGRFAEAALWYTRSIQKGPRNHLLFSNRSAAYLKLAEATKTGLYQRFEEDLYLKSLRDAKLCSVLEPGWEKGRARLASALASMEKAGFAVKNSLSVSLNVTPDLVLEAGKVSLNLQSLADGSSVGVSVEHKAAAHEGSTSKSTGNASTDAEREESWDHLRDQVLKAIEDRAADVSNPLDLRAFGAMAEGMSPPSDVSIEAELNWLQGLVRDGDAGETVLGVEGEALHRVGWAKEQEGGEFLGDEDESEEDGEEEGEGEEDEGDMEEWERGDPELMRLRAEMVERKREMREAERKFKMVERQERRLAHASEKLSVLEGQYQQRVAEQEALVGEYARWQQQVQGLQDGAGNEGSCLKTEAEKVQEITDMMQQCEIKTRRMEELAQDMQRILGEVERQKAKIQKLQQQLK